MNHYDNIASFYDLLARLIFGNKLITAKKHFIHRISPRSHILIIGGGTGDVLNDLLKDKTISVDFIEPSAGMIHQAEKNVPKECADMVRFIRGDQTNIPLDASYDCVITSFVFDLFREENAFVFGKTIYPFLKKDGIWIFTDFYKTKNPFQRLVLWSMFRFFKIATKIESDHVPDYEKIFSDLGMKKEDEYKVMNGFVKTILYKK